MDNKVYKIFVINPGSTSSKLSLYENEKEVLTEDIFHDAPVLLRYPTINDQLPFRIEQLVRDCHDCKSGVYHSSMLGVQMAWELYKEHKCLTLMLDPTVMDELDDLARITGVKGVYRRAATHALNLKATARKHAKAIGKRYEARWTPTTPAGERAPSARPAWAAWRSRTSSTSSGTARRLR